MKPGTGNREQGTAALSRRAALSATMLAMFALGGCALLGGNRDPATIYAPLVAAAPAPAWPALDGQNSH
jgi:hypothetical protein